MWGGPRPNPLDTTEAMRATRADALERIAKTKEIARAISRDPLSMSFKNLASGAKHVRVAATSSTE